jgi:8-oxo-dGTP pyrophosphatase MutT (NUDIX family)
VYSEGGLIKYMYGAFKMIDNKIRPIAVAALKHPDGRHLAMIYEDKVRTEKFFRLLGGGIEFGEAAKDALVREFKEELGTDITVGDQLKAYDKIFEFEGRKGHEIILIFEAEFTDKSFYNMEKIPVIEDNGRGDEHAVWIKIPEISHYGVIN